MTSHWYVSGWQTEPGAEAAAASAAPAVGIRGLSEVSAPVTVEHNGDRRGITRSQRNRLLAGLPDEERARIDPLLHRVDLAQRQLVFEKGEPIRHVYFPETAVVSLLSSLADGSTIEVASVGCEGMAGLGVFLADDSAFVRGIVQIPGAAVRLEADAFAQLTRAPGPLQHRMLRYTLSFLSQVAHTAACNATHRVEERCARWLLMTHDRVGDSRFPLTHEFLAFMLGVGRPGVTITMRALQDAGLIRYTRGSVEVVDRHGLERTSCECYASMQAEIERLLPDTVLTRPVE